VELVAVLVEALLVDLLLAVVDVDVGDDYLIVWDRYLIGERL
jgi:hypothetical protein